MSTSFAMALAKAAMDAGDKGVCAVHCKVCGQPFMGARTDCAIEEPADFHAYYKLGHEIRGHRGTVQLSCSGCDKEDAGGAE